ncbi:efflux RND transporter periplasmic adaptor subunit [Polymorphum gilvum]|uniref:Efflux transporter, RND family, MFP subunit n=1 Tax=Polymorphum gilvum (strain LMG 25793 / CGMCC 1.9160 / SL003B-26A1) TaxID=991905 RepID=F2IY80_POLGS|nr:HlyD family efflux transporter periplasmic adaptor subunit [Polymorphum gilvum]ADZ71692.1 Efflux transporter, RND family, MFP subunit [Polymorphum gilvum SL003B-26A1]
MLQSVEVSKSDQVSPLVATDTDGRRPLVLVLKALVQALVALAVLFGAVQGMRHLVATKPEVKKRPVQEKSYVVETVPVIIADHAPTINLYGEVAAGRQVDLRVLVAGEVTSVNPDLKAGGTILRGEDLIAVDRFDYEGAVTEAKANLLEARARQVELQGRVALQRDNLDRASEQLELAKRDLERAEQLRAGGSVTERTLDERRLLVSQRQQGLEQARNTLAVEEAGVRQQEAAIERLEWRLRQAERNLENTVLRAPFDAVVRTEAAQVGRLVNVNDVVASVYSRDELEVRFTLSDDQYGRLIAESGTIAGRMVEVFWFLGGETMTYTATVDRIGADVARSRGGVDIYARIEAIPDTSPLRPGAFVAISIPDRVYKGTGRIPESAYHADGRVFVVDGQRMATRRVEAVAFDDGYVLVRGDLVDGDKVISTRIPEAGDGILVEEVSASPGQPGAEAAEPPAAAAMNGSEN